MNTRINIVHRAVLSFEKKLYFMNENKTRFYIRFDVNGIVEMIVWEIKIFYTLSCCDLVQWNIFKVLFLRILRFQIYFCSYPIYDIWIVESIIQSTHLNLSFHYAKIWAFDIQKSCHSANHCHRSIWRKITPIYHERKCSSNRMEIIKMDVNIFNLLQTPTHLSQHTVIASMEVKIAWMIVHSCVRQSHKDPRHHRNIIHKVTHQSAHLLEHFVIIQMVSIIVSTIHHLVSVISSKIWHTARVHQVLKRFQSSSGQRHLSNVLEWMLGKMRDCKYFHKFNY